MDNPKTSDEDIKKGNITSETDNKLSASTTSDAEPPKKRRKLDETENKDQQVENKSPENNNGTVDVSKSGESISPQSRRKKRALNHKDKGDDDDGIEKWAKAIIKYHQQSEDLRIRCVTCYSSLQVFYKVSAKKSPSHKYP